MFLLALETSTQALSVALFRGQQLMDEIFLLPSETTHSEKLLPTIDTLLDQNQLPISQIQSFALSLGPGSYTSLRVGVATVMGLRAGKNQLVYGVSSLQVLSVGARFPENPSPHGVADAPSLFVAPVLKAGRGRIYGAVYSLQNGGGLNLKLKEAIYDPLFFLETIKANFQKVTMIGPGCEILKQGDPTVFPKASSVGQLVHLLSLPAMDSQDLRIRYFQEPDFGISCDSSNLTFRHK